MRWAGGAVGLGALPACLLATPARAEPSATINPGPLVSVVRSEKTYFGVGGELSFMVYDRPGGAGESIGIGGFGQFQSYDGDFGRHAFGLQVGSFIGGEVGYAYRESHGSMGGGHGLHAALYGSVGIMALSLRSTIPLVSAAADEVRHARICLALAQRRTRAPLSLGPTPIACRDVPSLGELGAESLADGWFGEGRAARDLWTTAASWSDPVEARCIASMAWDEGRHAALGLDVALAGAIVHHEGPVARGRVRSVR